MNTKTYETSAGLGKTAQTLREFGERQNDLNAKLVAEVESLQRQREVLAEHLGEALDRIDALEKVLETALERVTALEKAQELNIKRFQRCANDLDKAETAINRLKVTAKLNTNAIDRLAKHTET